MIDLTCFVDGGYNNVTKSNGYGSFKIISNTDEIIKRIDYDWVKSSNEAEYETILQLLVYVHENYPENVNLRIFSDSKLMVNQINNLWKINVIQLKNYHYIVTNLMKNFSLVSLTWVPRKIIVRQLGH